MLRSFRLENHRSFAGEQELLLMPAVRAAERPVVPISAIYGANASGKSNLVDGLSFMRSAVLNSFSRWEIDGTPRTPFRLDLQTRLRPSVFVVEFLVENVPYVYGFTLNDSKIIEEWLYSYPEKRRRVVFERKDGEIKFGPSIAGAKAKADVLEDMTRPNALFLSAGVRMGLEALRPAYEWFRNGLYIRRSADVLLTRLPNRIESFVSRGSENLGRLVGLLAASDVGITGLRLVKTEDTAHVRRLDELKLMIKESDELLKTVAGSTERDRLVRQRNTLELAYQDSRARVVEQVELKFVHGDNDELFDLADESAGTRSWLNLLPTVLDVLDRGRVIMVDEIDTSLHPLLTTRLVRLFADTETNPHSAQLIFTTHDTSLLGTMIGHEVLARDQVWFVQKGASGASELYPLTDFKPRKDQNTERRYLGGSYGAVPVLDQQDFVDAVLGR